MFLQLKSFLLACFCRIELTKTHDIAGFEGAAEESRTPRKPRRGSKSDRFPITRFSNCRPITDSQPGSVFFPFLGDVNINLHEIGQPTIREDLLRGFLSSRNLKIAVFTINVAAWPWLGRACVPPRSGGRGRPPSPPPGGVTPQPCASPGARWRCGSRGRSSRRGCSRTTRSSRCRKVPSRDCPAATP